LEYLGLHNKPKAEVHQGHKLTGPKEEEEEEEEEEEKEEERKKKKRRKKKKGRRRRRPMKILQQNLNSSTFFSFTFLTQ
jgi:hypothetical protein